MIPALPLGHDTQLLGYPRDLLLKVHLGRLADGLRRFVGRSRIFLRGPPWLSFCSVLRVPGLTSTLQSNGETPGSDTTNVPNIPGHSHPCGTARPLTDYLFLTPQVVGGRAKHGHDTVV
jgi:hypothetical protein